jgi:hypothetical protein
VLEGEVLEGEAEEGEAEEGEAWKQRKQRKGEFGRCYGMQCFR